MQADERLPTWTCSTTVNAAQDGWESSFTFKSPSPNQVDTLWEFVSIVGVCSEERESGEKLQG